MHITQLLCEFHNCTSNFTRISRCCYDNLIGDSNSHWQSNFNNSIPLMRYTRTRISYSFWHGFYLFLAVSFDVLSWYHIWLMAFISLIMVVQSNFCNWGCVMDHKFSMGLRSGEFPSQSNTFNFVLPENCLNLFRRNTRGKIRLEYSFTIRKCSPHVWNDYSFIYDTSMYLFEFIILWIRISETTP